MMETWLGVRDAARLIGVSETLIRRWAGQGKLPCLRTLRGRRSFTLEAILAYRAARAERRAAAGEGR